MMAAVKAQDDRGGERGARADWVWECWEKDWSFRQDSEVWGEFLTSHHLWLPSGIDFFLIRMYSALPL